MKKILLIALFIGTLFCVGCQKAPADHAVVGKNENALDSALYETQPNDESMPSQIQFTGCFTSTDGSVNFNWDIDQTVSADKMPVVEVEPMHLSDEDIRRVAETLVGDVLFYEREPSTNPQYSRSQYQEMIGRLAPYSNLEAMTDLVGADNAEDMLESVKDTIAKITEAMENAPEENPLRLCDWTLKKERIYNDSDLDIGDRTLAEDNDWLVATAEKDGIGYKYMVVVRDQEDYKLCRFNLQLGGASMDTYMDRKIYWSKLCRTGEPTQQQIEDAQGKVMQLLDDMELGDWEIAEIRVDVLERGADPEFLLRIWAVPVLNGVSAVYGQKNPDKAEDYTGAYVLTQAEFIMSANGDLIDMQLDSPLEVKAVLNENVATLSFSQLIERAEQHLSLSDAGNYGFIIDESQEECDVNISELEYGLARIPIENTIDSYYYVPALMIRGDVEYRDKETGYVFYSVTDTSLVCINAIDGSVID